MTDPYVVLIPGKSGNATKKHLVVRASQWAALVLGELDAYTEVREYTGYSEAAAARTLLNTQKKKKAA